MSDGDRDSGHGDLGLRLPDDVALREGRSRQGDGSNERGKRARGEDAVGDHVVGGKIQCETPGLAILSVSSEELLSAWNERTNRLATLDLCWNVDMVDLAKINE